MPLTLEQVISPTEQDLIDLEKLFQDYPEQTRWQDVQQWLSENPDTQIFAGRFNDRLLGAVTLTTHANEITINHLCVRKVTRQRAVGKDLLRLIFAQNKGAQFSITICHSSEANKALLKKLGFTEHNDQHWTATA